MMVDVLVTVRNPVGSRLATGSFKAELRPGGLYQREEDRPWRLEAAHTGKIDDVEIVWPQVGARVLCEVPGPQRGELIYQWDYINLDWVDQPVVMFVHVEPERVQ